MYEDDLQSFFIGGLAEPDGIAEPVPVRIEPNHLNYSTAGWRDRVFGPTVKVDMDTVRAQYEDRPVGTVRQDPPRNPLSLVHGLAGALPVRMYSALRREDIIAAQGFQSGDFTEVAVTSEDEVFWASIDPLPAPRPRRLSARTINRIRDGHRRFVEQYGRDPFLVENDVEWASPTCSEYEERIAQGRKALADLTKEE